MDVDFRSSDAPRFCFWFHDPALDVRWTFVPNLVKAFADSLGPPRKWGSCDDDRKSDWKGRSRPLAAFANKSASRGG